MTDLPFLLQASDVFGILELVAEVVFQLWHADLPSFAHVSNKCHYEAIRRLWMVLPSAVPLFGLIPEMQNTNGLWVSFLSFPCCEIIF